MNKDEHMKEINEIYNDIIFIINMKTEEEKQIETVSV